MSFPEPCAYEPSPPVTLSDFYGQPTAEDDALVDEVLEFSVIGTTFSGAFYPSPPVTMACWNCGEPVSSSAGYFRCSCGCDYLDTAPMQTYCGTFDPHFAASASCPLSASRNLEPKKPRLNHPQIYGLRTRDEAS